MTAIAVVQARTGSTRFPNKVLRPVCGEPLIGFLLRRLRGARTLDGIVLATSVEPRDNALAEYVESLGFAVFRGSEHDVLDRFYQAALGSGASEVVRVTGDCPLIDPELVDRIVEHRRSTGADYATNTLPPTYPDGLDCEVMLISALERAWREASDLRHREHVTPYLREHPAFHRENVASETDWSSERWTVDEPEDLAIVEAVARHFAPRIDFAWAEVLELLREDPEMFEANRSIQRNEGAEMSSGQKLWKRAKRVIPGGNMLLSKRAEMFLPEQWPAYFQRASGCQVWDLDGKQYTDVCIMGVGTNILGYGHPTVDEAVAATVAAGNMSTLNCPEEVWLAERLVELHPWADMVRLARTGGEADAIAVRIARAAAGKDRVAICGYHGWHDWYLSANLADDAGLDGHLLPGLDPAGVPRGLAGTVLPFRYNRFDELEALGDRYPDLGVIMMEVSRNEGPQDGFLERVRDFASARGIVLVFDECTSGFRETFGGLHMKYGVEPDIAMFGKALGNGYAITAVVGRREVMEAAQRSFISSTFWTERIGPTAALQTLNVMEQTRSWETITATGHSIRKRMTELAERHGIQIDQWGLPALTGYTVRSEHAAEYKTLISQEMLSKGFLAGNAVFVSVAHTPEILEAYFAGLDDVFKLVAQCEQGAREVNDLLRGPVCHTGFKRLN